MWCCLACTSASSPAQDLLLPVHAGQASRYVNSAAGQPRTNMLQCPHTGPKHCNESLEDCDAATLHAIGRVFTPSRCPFYRLRAIAAGVRTMSPFIFGCRPRFSFVARPGGIDRFGQFQLHRLQILNGCIIKHTVSRVLRDARTYRCGARTSNTSTPL
jgi:hypothetical protein